MKENNSYISLPRSLHESEAWQRMSDEQLRAFLDLCFRANYVESDYECKYGTIRLQKGQMVSSLRQLAEQWECCISKVRRILIFFEKYGLISRSTVLICPTHNPTPFSPTPTVSATILTINHLYDSCQDEMKRNPTHDLEQERINNNLSDDKFKTTVKRAREKFEIPTIEEIQQYLDEKGEHRFTAQAFYDFYDACGWVVGKDKPMKSWRGAIGIWIQKENKDSKNNNKSHGNQIYDRADQAEAARARREQEFEQSIIDILNHPERFDDNELPFH